jgi:hypothetical protein
VAKKKKNSWVSWSEEELRLLKRLYRDNTMRDVAKQIGRSISAILRRTHKLGLRKKGPPWSKKEVALLRKLYLTHQDKEIAAKIGRSTGSVAIERARLGLKKRGVYGV